MSSWGRVRTFMTRPRCISSQPCLFISIDYGCPSSNSLRRVPTIWYIRTNISVRHLLGGFAEELVISRVTSHLVYDICWRILLFWGSKCIGHWWPGLRRQFPPVTP
ncbi:hypothetical protein PAHAL_3G368000 [Panicum hallii]|uniref:Uncharacterized protein n=1 Tax=Panicum hallii TaxID=206008 RepID=A0A2T8KKH1_9POAL|nr:hypothetical protein PAHAL_3G368000 [Panicum hallii]